MQLGLKRLSVVQYTFTHKQYTKQHIETEYNTYIRIKLHKHTIRIHKQNNKDILITDLFRNTTISK